MDRQRRRQPGVCGAFVCARRRSSDALILSRPARAPGDREPVEIMREAASRGIELPDPSAACRLCAENLGKPSESHLVKELSRFPGEMLKAAENLEAHRIAFYATALAKAFHAFYNNEKVQDEEHYRKQKGDGRDDKTAYRRQPQGHLGITRKGEHGGVIEGREAVVRLASGASV